MAAHRVLVVDDNHEIRRMVTASIKSLSAEIDVLDVPSAEEALFISASLPLDLVVLDFRLPGMTGLEMVTRLRRRIPGTKIILVTGVEDANVRQQITQAEVENYFFKPIEIGVFLDAVKHCLWTDQGGVPGIRGAALYPAVNHATTNQPAPGKTKSMPLGEGEAKSEIKHGFKPTLDERLTSLKQQVRASSVLLLNDIGQVVEMAGNPSQITSGSELLPALMEAFRASQKVTDALGTGPNESLLYFTNGKQRIYLAPVGQSNVLLLVTIGYIEPDKLGLLDRAIHLAVQDLDAILEHMLEEDDRRIVEAEASENELASEIIIDKKTLTDVERMFSKAPKKSSKDQADGFWETLAENSELDGTSSKDVISYEQARDMGLAPENDEKT
jgi:CheY-like chemotaxis protein